MNEHASCEGNTVLLQCMFDFFGKKFFIAKDTILKIVNLCNSKNFYNNEVLY